MKTKNTIGKIEYIIEHIFWLFITWMNYRNILFKCLPGHSLIESKFILFGMVVFCIAVGISFQYKRNRNGISILMNFLLGYGVYTAVSYYPFRKNLIVIIGVFTVLVSAVWSLFILCRKVRNRNKLKKVMKRRFIYSAYSVRNICCIGLGMLMMINGINAVFGNVLIIPAVSAVNNQDGDEWNIRDHIDSLCLLKEESWKNLNVQEKLDVLQIAVNIEQVYLGLPHELNVGADSLEEGREGYYNDSEHLIVVNMERLAIQSGEELLDTVIHEARHAYQHRSIEAYDQVSDDLKPLLLFYNARLFKEEFADYTDGFKDFSTYYSQACESDARRYAEYETEYYFSMIEQYCSN